MLASLVASFAGILYAVQCGVAADGGRGGAVAVAISFAAYFTARPTPTEMIEARNDAGEVGFDNLDIDARSKRLRSAISVMLDRQTNEAVYLTISSVSGTLIWGFGDVIAKFFGAPS
jgi:hypothetical protein